MPELIQQRTMQRPGEGIVPALQPTQQHQEYPKHMRHAGFAPATTGEEIKSPHGFTYHKGGTPQRYPPVMVHNVMDEDHHKSLGYETVGTCSPESFARLVASNAPPIETHVAVEYPKWVNGKLVHTAEQEAALTGRAIPTSSEAAGAPSIDTEVNTLQVWPSAQGAAGTTPVARVSDDDEIAALEARLAELREKNAEKARRVEELKAAIAAELAEEEADPVAKMHADYAERMNPPEANTTCDVLIAPGMAAGDDAEKIAQAKVKATASKSRSAAIKAGLAKKKADKLAATKGVLTESA